MHKGRDAAVSFAKDEGSIDCARCAFRIGRYDVHISETDRALCPSCFTPLSDSFDFAPFSHRRRPTVVDAKWALVALHAFHVCGSSRRCLQRAHELRSQGFLVAALAVRGGGLWSDKFAAAFDELIFLRSTRTGVPDWLVERLTTFSHAEAHYQPAIGWCLDHLPSCSSLSASFHTEPLGYYDDGPLLLRLLDRNGAVHFPTEALREQYRRLLPPSRVSLFDERSALSPHGASELDVAPTALFRELLQFGVPGKRIGVVTRLDPDKLSPSLLVSTIDLVLEAEPEACIIIAGPGEDSDNIRALFRPRRYSGHVHFTGYVDSVQDIYLWADIMFLPSWTEVRPFTVLEAARFGKVTVAPELRAMRDAFSDRYLLSFETGCSRQAARLLLAAMQSTRHPASARQ